MWLKFSTIHTGRWDSLSSLPEPTPYELQTRKAGAVCQGQCKRSGTPMAAVLGSQEIRWVTFRLWRIWKHSGTALGEAWTLGKPLWLLWAPSLISRSLMSPAGWHVQSTCPGDSRGPRPQCVSIGAACKAVPAGNQDAFQNIPPEIPELFPISSPSPKRANFCITHPDLSVPLMTDCVAGGLLCS